MTHLIQIIRGNARPDRRSRDIQHLPRQPTNGAHGLLPIRIQRLNLIPIQLPLAPGYARLRPVGMLDRFRDSAMRRKRIDRPHGAGKRVRRERVIGAGNWIGFRDDAGRDEFAKNPILSLALWGLVEGFVLALVQSVISTEVYWWGGW